MENQEINQRNIELFAELAKCPKDSKKYQDIVSKIVKNNERLVKYVAYKHFSTLMMKPTLNSDDLISAGYFGLWKAIELYQPEKGDFPSYAAWCIQGCMLRHLSQERKHNRAVSLEDDKNGTERKLKDNLASPVNLEADFVEKYETDRQLAWIRKNLNELSPFQKKVLISRYLSGEASLRGNALAKELDRTRQDISQADRAAIKKLRKMYYESHPEEIKIEKKEEIELTSEEKIKMKEVLKNLISTKLPPQQKRIMLCKFYSATEKTNGQVAQKFSLAKENVSVHIGTSCKKLCTLCGSIKDQKPWTSKAIRDILQSRIEGSGKEL